MAQALWMGALPWGFALNNVTNDLIWRLPFALILKYAWERHQADPGANDLSDEADV